MPILSSSALAEHAQVDGRFFVTERHTDHTGAVHTFAYLAAVGADTSAVMSARVPVIEAQLADAEFADCLANDRLTTVHLTAADFLAKVREAYRERSREELARLAQYIVNRIQAGDVTETQLRNAFGLNVTQWNALKSRMQALRDAWVVVQAAAGE